MEEQYPILKDSVLYYKMNKGNQIKLRACSSYRNINNTKWTKTTSRLLIWIKEEVHHMDFYQMAKLAESNPEILLGGLISRFKHKTTKNMIISYITKGNQLTNHRRILIVCTNLKILIVLLIRIIVINIQLKNHALKVELIKPRLTQQTRQLVELQAVTAQ